MRNFKIALLILYAFFLLYLPDFSYLHFIFSPSLIVIALSLVNLLLLNRRLFSFITLNHLFPLLFLLLLPLGYVVVLNIYGSYPFEFYNFNHNILQYFNIINYLSLVLWIDKLLQPENAQDYLDFIYNIGLIQATIILIMLVSPSAKQLAINLFSQNEEVPPTLSYIFSNRVYGIASSYTFMLPFVQAVLALFSFYSFHFTNHFKYLFISVLLILSSLMNNRTGFFIYSAIVIFYLLFITLRRNSKTFVLIVLSLPILLIGFFIFFPKRMDWILSVIVEVYNYIIHGESTGYVYELTQTHAIIPTGWELIVGTGQQIFGSHGRNVFGFSSDIGYSNDLFKGGIIYIVMHYMPIIIYLNKEYRQSLVFYGNLVFLLLANYKGIVFTGSPVIMLFLFLVFVFNLNNYYKEEGRISYVNFNHYSRI